MYYRTNEVQYGNVWLHLLFAPPPQGYGGDMDVAVTSADGSNCVFEVMETRHRVGNIVTRSHPVKVR